MSKNLVIVESPAKAKTIEGYLGKDFTVKSSFGHVRDLPKDGIAVDVQNGFRPAYEVSPDKRQLISELKKLAKDADVVWLATDDDREGEAISWHLKEALGLKADTNRIVFREITKNAILNAIKVPRTIDLDLVNAQQARRVLDRLVGYELSPVLWRKIKGGSTGLSAGRVQSVALRLVVDREREIDKHQSKSSFKVTAQFVVDGGKILNAELAKNFATADEARAFLAANIGAGYTIKNLEVKPAKKSPSAPFTTSTLQQEASRKLGFAVDRTMRLAQGLYEAGKISYMRTDSTSLSQEAVEKAVAEITTEFGPKYVQTRVYKTKNESAQEAHEAIRPTNFNDRGAGADKDQKRLYELIWKRAIASQMADAQLERTTVTISIRFDNAGLKSGAMQTAATADDSLFWEVDVVAPDFSPAKGATSFPNELVAQGEVVKFDGFLRVYFESKDDEEDEDAKGMLPPLRIGQELAFGQMKATEKFTRPQPRYAEASLVKKLEEMGIGRPSTYAPTISTIVNRGYVVKEDRQGQERKFTEFTLVQRGPVTETIGKENYGSEKAKLFPTNTGIVVNDFLVEYFPDIVDFKFTATVEKEFDEIADGKLDWQKMLEGFYGDFHKNVVDIQGSSVVGFKTGARELGIDPKSGKKVSARLGKYGAFVQIGESTEDEKPLYANLRKDQLIETITLQEAIELFALPREVGFFEDKAMTIGIGKFGPYVKHDDKYVSLSREDDPYTIDEARTIELIQQKAGRSGQRSHR